MKIRHLTRALTLTALLAAGISLIAGCNTQSGTDTVREVDVNFTGLYSGTDRKLVSQNSGDEILTLNLNQVGAGLEAFDNNGIIFRGNLGRVSADGAASFTLRGVTTAGQEATITGTLSGSGSEGRMAGTWVENSRFGVVSGTASIAEVVENTDTGTDTGNTGALTISPTGNQTITVGQARTFSAAGGTGNVTWTMSNAQIGRLSTTTGAQVSYTALAAGAQTLTARSGNDSGSVSITQSGGTAVGTGIDTGGLGINGLFSEGGE